MKLRFFPFSSDPCITFIIYKLQHINLFSLFYLIIFELDNTIYFLRDPYLCLKNVCFFSALRELLKIVRTLFFILISPLCTSIFKLYCNFPEMHVSSKQFSHRFLCSFIFLQQVINVARIWESKGCPSSYLFDW